MNWQLGQELVSLLGIPKHLEPVSKQGSRGVPRADGSRLWAHMPAALPGRISELPRTRRPLPSKGQTTHPENSPPVPTYLPPAAQGFGFARPQGC